MRQGCLAETGMKIVDRILLEQQRIMVCRLDTAALLGRISFSEQVVQAAQDQLIVYFRHFPTCPHPQHTVVEW